MLLSLFVAVVIMVVFGAIIFSTLYINEKYEISEKFDSWVHENNLFVEVSGIPAIVVFGVLGLAINDKFGHLMLIVAGIITIADVIYFIIKSVIKKGFNKDKSMQTFCLLIFVPILMAAIKTGGIEGTMAVIALTLFVVTAIVGIWKK